MPVPRCTRWDAQRGFRLRLEDAAYHGSSSSSGSSGLLLEAVVDVAVVSLGGAACVGFQLLLPTGLKAHRAGKAELGLFEKPSQTQRESCRREKKILKIVGPQDSGDLANACPFPLVQLLVAAAIGCCESNTAVNDFTTLITISPSSSHDLVVSHCPHYSFPASFHPWCISGRYFRGWGCQPHIAAGGKRSGRAAWCEQFLNHLVTPRQRHFGNNFGGF